MIRTAWYPAVISRAGLHIDMNSWLSTALLALNYHPLNLAISRTGCVAKVPSVRAQSLN